MARAHSGEPVKALEQAFAKAIADPAALTAFMNSEAAGWGR
ncbi:MAG: hypothetical protein ABI624_09790 [Casimicrobiaceae bacterium]